MCYTFGTALILGKCSINRPFFIVGLGSGESDFFVQLDVPQMAPSSSPTELRLLLFLVFSYRETQSEIHSVTFCLGSCAWELRTKRRNALIWSSSATIFCKTQGGKAVVWYTLGPLSLANLFSPVPLPVK